MHLTQRTQRVPVLFDASDEPT